MCVCVFVYTFIYLYIYMYARMYVSLYLLYRQQLCNYSMANTYIYTELKSTHTHTHQIDIYSVVKH